MVSLFFNSPLLYKFFYQIDTRDCGVKVVIVSVSFKAFWVFGFIFIGILNEMENLDYYVLFKESLYLITQV